MLNDKTYYRQLAIGLPQINIEQEDNARNTTLLQTHSSDSETSSPELSKRNNDNKNIVINQTINQNIRMNVKIP